MAEQDILDAIAGLAAAVAAIDAKVGAATVTVTAPITISGDVTVVQGDDYALADGREISWTNRADTWPNLSGAAVIVRVEFPEPVEYLATVITPTGTQTIHLELGAADTADMPAGQADYRLVATLAPSRHVTLIQGHWTVTGTRLPAVDEGS